MKTKTCLFIMNDGVNLYPRQEFFLVPFSHSGDGIYSGHELFTIYPRTIYTSYELSPSDSYKRFSTMENAENWVKENKPNVQ